MDIVRRLRTLLIALFLVCGVLTNLGCSSTATQVSQPSSYSSTYAQLERGNTTSGQTFGDWVVSTSNGLIQDAYVRDNDKLGVVISSQVRPNEVRELARSLVQGFQRNFPNRNLDVLVYAPDKQLIMTAKYNDTTRQIEYQVA